MTFQNFRGRISKLGTHWGQNWSVFTYRGLRVSISNLFFFFNQHSVDRGGSDELSFNSVLHKNYNS